MIFFLFLYSLLIGQDPGGGGGHREVLLVHPDGQVTIQLARPLQVHKAAVFVTSKDHLGIYGRIIYEAILEVLGGKFGVRPVQQFAAESLRNCSKKFSRRQCIIVLIGSQETQGGTSMVFAVTIEQS
jgi:hypothetical protein